MNFLLFPRVLDAVVVDASVSVLAGLLLAALWLRGNVAIALPSLRPPALVFLLALCTQVGLLTASFTGETAPAKVWAALPDVLTTHPGKVAEITVVAALLLFAFTLLPLSETARLAGGTLLLGVCVALRSATGHAAVDGDFSLAEWLQFAHLVAMALWSGGILVSGLVALPQFAGSERLRKYLGSLSTVSTWAVATVAASGAMKSWRAVGGDLHLLRGSVWAYILGGKIVFVTLAIALGGLNRLHLRKPAPWSATENRRAIGLLRVEACAMAAVLVLSAWLANMSPPGE